MTKPKVIFFGNGILAKIVFETIKPGIELVFWAKTKEDLDEVVKIMEGNEHKIYGVLASFGVIIPKRVLELFEPEGILNIHPSYLPELRGPSPIETAMLRGETEFGVSVMKLVPKMDAGPIYHQEKLDLGRFVEKTEVYEKLGKAGAEWLIKHLEDLPKPVEQEGTPTFSKMLDTSLASLRPDEQTTEEMFDQVRAFAGFPKSRMMICDIDCIILRAHIANEPEIIRGHKELSIKGKDGLFLVIDELQPAGKKAMAASAFANGYLR
ncbi:hypothetical protein IJ114_01390 [Candidatus Saccharibacteria bacterium]|nr:hypothetical protein [Candidatus Saccharibacteria bacterium]